MDSIKNQTMGVSYDAYERMVRRTRPGVLNTIDTVSYWYDGGDRRIGKEYRYHYVVQCNDTTPIELLGMQMLGEEGLETEAMSSGPGGNCSAVTGTLTGYYYFGDDMEIDRASWATSRKHFLLLF